MADKKDPFAAYQKPLESSGNDPFSAYQKPAMDFTPTPGMGTYRMLPSSQQGYTDGSKEIQVSYDKVNDALKSGLRLHPDEEKRFKDDSTHEGQGPSLWEKTKKFYDEQTTPIPDYEQRPIDPKHPITSTLGRLGDASANVGLMVPNTARAAVRGVVGLFSILPQSKDIIEKVRNGDPSAFNDLAEFYPPRIAYNMLDQYKNDANTVGPTQALSNLTGNMTALYVGGKAGGKLGEKVKETASNPAEVLNNVKTKAANIKDVPGNLVRKTAEIVTNTQPRNVKDLESKAWSEALEHKNATAEELGKRSDARDAEVKAVKEHNARVAEKHKVASEKIEREREAAEHALELRRTEESKLEKDTQDHFDKIDATKARVKASADAKWNPVHQSLDAKTIDGGNIETPLAKILEISPDVRREISQLIPDPEDADQTSPYVKKRNEVLAARGHKNPQATYDAMDDFNKKLTDSIVEREGFTPDPIDLDPKSGVEIPFDKIHRAQSIIGRNIRNGRYGYEGPLRGEMAQLQKVLYNAESKIAADNGMSADLDDARQATREYQESFGRQRNIPKNGDDVLKQRENPEKFKKDNEQELLDAASKHDPSLATEYEKIKEQREKVKNMKTEDQLRESLKQPIPPPSLDHPEETYRLKREPEPFTGKPTERDEPTGERKHDESGKTVWAEDKLKDRIKPVSISEDDASKIAKSADEFRKMGIRRALFAGLTGLAFSATTFLNGVGMEHSALGGLGAAGAVLMGSDWIANLLDRPDFVKWMSKVTPAKIEEFNKLPPEQKALFTEDMRKIADAARNKGIKVSPYLDQWLMMDKERSIGEGRIAGASAAGASQKKRKDLVDKWNKEHPDKQVTPPQPSTSPSPTDAPNTIGGQSSNQGPQSSTKPLTRQDVLAKAAELQDQFRNAGVAS